MAVGDFHITTGSQSGNTGVNFQPASGVKWIVKVISGYYGYQNYSSLNFVSSGNYYSPISYPFRHALDDSTSNGNVGFDSAAWTKVSIPIDNSKYLRVSHSGNYTGSYTCHAIEWD